MSASTGNWYCYWQQSGEDNWIPALATSRAEVLASKSPRYMSVLDINTNVTHDTPREELDALAYKGDLYIDIDVSKEMGGIETAIVQINTLIDKFAALGVKPETLRIFASGSKGFHLEIPKKTYQDREPKNGQPHLPAIFKELVHTGEIYVDGIDNRVYSAGRGRMWRSTNVQRENGRYKVQVSLEECRNLTPEIYDEYVSGPRPILNMPPAEYCSTLAVMYATAHDTIVARRKSMSKSKADPLAVARWAKKPPAELTALLNGKGLREGAGFHPIAIQVAMAANTLGWSVDDMLDRAENLINNHHGDGNRYDSPRKRKRELTRLWYYFQGGSGTYYEFALQPMRALLDVQAAAVAAGATEEAMNDDDADESEEEINDAALTAGVRIRRRGMFKATEKGEARASAIGFDNVVQLIDVDTKQTTGYQADMYLDGKKLGNKLMNLDLFSSRQNMQGFALANGGASLHLSDQQVVGLAEIFRNKALRSDSRVYIVNREGLDYLRQKGGKVHSVYVSHQEFFTNSGDDAPLRYALKLNGRETKPVESDILHAPELSGTTEERDFLNHFLRINSPANMGKMLGWFTAAFVSQAIRMEFDQFPLLHIYGTAGAGKTATCRLLANLHYYWTKPEITGIAGTTGHAMKTRLTSSASIPLIWDEYKPHTMKAYILEDVKQYLRNNYTATKAEMGTVRRDTGQSHLDLRQYLNCAPVVFVGETMETETALGERYVAVGLTKRDKEGLDESFRYCKGNRQVLGHIGKSIISHGLVLDRKAMKAQVEQYEVLVSETIRGASVSDDSRRIFNYAVTLYGIDLLKDTIEVKFPGEYGETFDKMKQALLSSITADLPRNMSESSKVLAIMAFLTKVETQDQYRLVFGQDYTCSDNTVDVKLQSAFTKYLQYSRSVGQSPLFPDYGRFVAAMKKYPATVDDVCLDNDTLKDNYMVDVFRFSAEGLAREGIELFRGQLGAKL